MPGGGTGPTLSDLEIIARLANYPWDKSKEEIERLDPWWCINVLFYPRDSQGKFAPLPVEQEEKKPSRTPRDEFFYQWGKRGLAKWEIQKLWQELEGGHGT